MGCGQKAVADDEDDWDSLCKEANIKVLWDCYSNKARYARDGYTKFKLKGVNLVRYVELMVEVQLLVADQRKEDDERAFLEVLRKKYG
jgi:hypothetical protein